MAFPSILSFTSNEDTTEDTSFEVSLPAGVQSGDLLVAGCFVLGQNASIGMPSGWTQVLSAFKTGTGTPWLAVGYKKADGTEGASVTFDGTQNHTSAGVCYRISGYDYDGWTSGDVAIESATNASDTESLDPPSLSPKWGGADTLWLVFGTRLQGTVTAAPTNYVNLLNPRHDVGVGAEGGSAFRENNTITENPGAFGQSISPNGAVAATVAIAPDGVGYRSIIIPLFMNM